MTLRWNVVVTVRLPGRLCQIAMSTPGERIRLVVQVRRLVVFGLKVFPCACGVRRAQWLPWPALVVPARPWARLRDLRGIQLSSRLLL